MSVMAIRNLLLACDNGNCTCQPEGKYVAMCIWHCNKGCSKRNIVDVGKIPTPDFYHYKTTVCKISRFFLDIIRYRYSLLSILKMSSESEVVFYRRSAAFVLAFINLLQPFEYRLSIIFTVFSL